MQVKSKNLKKNKKNVLVNNVKDFSAEMHPLVNIVADSYLRSVFSQCTL